MRATTLKATLKALYGTELKRSVCIEGPPGGGKTTIVKEVADDLREEHPDFEYREIPMATALVEDFGIPFLDPVTGNLKFKLLDWFPVKGVASDPVSYTHLTLPTM
jgi:Cdc6-like AAA superfamily ATPase